MAKELIPPRQRLAKNLRSLAQREGYSGHEIARRTGNKIDPKTVNNMLRAAYDPRLTQVEKVANVFGMTAWQLLAYDLAERPPDSKKVVRLLENYSSAPDDGREAIVQVAEIPASKAM